MASETKILEAIFGPSIPTEQAAVLPEIMAHIRAIDGLLQGKPRQYHPRISNPAISGPINRMIGELYAEHGKWPLVAAAICQEFNVQISPDACRGRHKDAVARQEAYTALPGSTILAGQYTTPSEVAQKIDEPQSPDSPPQTLLAALEEHEAQTHEILGSILGNDDSLEIVAQRIVDRNKELEGWLVDERARRICHQPREDSVGHWSRYDDVVVQESRQQLTAEGKIGGGDIPKPSKPAWEATDERQRIIEIAISLIPPEVRDRVEPVLRAMLEEAGQDA